MTRRRAARHTPPSPHDARNCARKLRYRSLHSASIARERLAERETTPPDPYRCPVCRGWHLGHHVVSDTLLALIDEANNS